MSACNRTSIADVVGAIVGHSMPTVGVVMMSRGTCFLIIPRKRMNSRGLHVAADRVARLSYL